MKRLQSLKFLLVLASVLALASCANLQEPAKKVIADTEATLATAGADAQQYVPDQYAAVQQKLTDLKAAFDKRDYKAVVDGGPGLLSAAKGLADAAAAKKREVMEALNGQWTGYAASIPQSLAAVEARLAALKGKKLPSGVSKDGVAAAKTGVEEVKSAWTDASTTFGGGNLQSAVDKAKAVKAKLDEISAKLGISAAAKPAG